MIAANESAASSLAVSNARRREWMAAEYVVAPLAVGPSTIAGSRPAADQHVGWRHRLPLQLP